MSVSKLMLALLGLGVMVGSLQAQELTGRLKKIKDTGSITLGVRDSSIPFSYLDDNQKYLGYSIDLCQEIVKQIGTHLGVPPLKTKMIPVTSATRIPLIANGTADLSCDSATNNLERQKQVSFTPTTFIAINKILAKKSANIKSLSDLKGKKVVSTSGTSNLKALTILNNEKNLDMSIQATKDHAEAFLMVETDRAVAFVMDDVLLAGLAANSKAPNDYVIVDNLSVEPYGLIEPKDDPAFKKVVDDALKSLYASGKGKQIYAKWFQNPIPPKNINLNLPMSPQLEKAFAHPTDSGDPLTYK